MELTYDVRALPFLWSPLLFALGIWYVALFAASIGPYSKEGEERRAEFIKGAVIASAITVFLGFLVFNEFRSRYLCRNAPESEIRVVEGAISDFKDVRRIQEAQFRLQGRAFRVGSGSFSRSCGFTPSLTEEMYLRDGDLIRLEYIGQRTILRAWRIKNPPAN